MKREETERIRKESAKQRGLLMGKERKRKGLWWWNSVWRSIGRGRMKDLYLKGNENRNKKWLESKTREGEEYMHGQKYNWEDSSNDFFHIVIRQMEIIIKRKKNDIKWQVFALHYKYKYRKVFCFTLLYK